MKVVFDAECAVEAILASGSPAKYFYGEDDKKKESKHYVSYVRVSTNQQDVTTLSMKAQTEMILNQIKKSSGHVLKEFAEVGSGLDKPGPELRNAMNYCRATGAMLIVATLDRLSRNLHFVSGLLDENFKFIIAEYPDAPPRFIAQLALDAQFNATHNNKMTKETLAVSQKPKGVKGRENLLKDPESVARGRTLGAAAMKANADEYTRTVIPFIKPLLQEGFNHSQIAEKLNDAHVLSARGKSGKWTAQSVRNILARAAALLLIDPLAATKPRATGKRVPSVLIGIRQDS